MVKELRTPTVWIDSMFPENSKKCEACSVNTATNVELEPSKYCKLADLEIKIKRIPTVTDAQKVFIDLNKIPKGCPNEYISIKNLLLTNRKKK